VRTLIRNGTVITAEGVSRAEVLVDGARIDSIGEGLRVEADRVIDATGQYVMPGGVDVHTHLDMPLGDIVSADDFESGTMAAACGGTTTIVDFAAQGAGESLAQALDAWMRRADGKAVIDYGFHMSITDLTPEVEREMDALVAGGVPSFKVFMAYPGRMMLDDGSIFRAMARTRDNGGLVLVHAENGPVIDVLVRRALAEGRTGARYHALTRPPGTEAEATSRAIALAELAGAPVYIVHLSSAAAFEPVRSARAAGRAVFAETCPQYLLLSEECYDAPGFDAARYVMSPPLRPRAGQERLWRGLADGDLQVVATDHCPFTLAQKARGRDDFTRIPNGAPGIETRLSLVYDAGVRSGRLSLERFVDVVATSPARLFGLYPAKGTLAPGADADVLVFDPHRRMTLSAKTLHMRVDYSPYEGREVEGAPVSVLSRGEVIVEDGQFVGRRGRGRFLRRSARS
jgi:dihydropyrimidinase